VTPAELSLIFGFAFAGAHAIVVSVCLRFIRSLAPVILHLVCAAVMGAALAATIAVVAARSGIALPFWPAASIFYGGVIAWLYAFSAVYKSISLGILRALQAAPERRIGLDAVARDFVWPRFVERVDLLVDGGLASRTETGYEISPEGLKAVRRLRLIQRAFAVSGKGFYLTS
jgi:hypothetical protein